MMVKKGKRAVFFDRDGVIFKPIRKVGEGSEPGAVRAPHSRKDFVKNSGLVPGVKEVLEALRSRNFLVILITNQPDITYGNMDKETWEWIHNHISHLPFDDQYICFHGKDEGCECKKPKPGMLFSAAEKWDIDLGKSYFVGDTESDTGAASAAEVKSILIDAWYNQNVKSDYRILSLEEVLRIAQ